MVHRSNEVNEWDQDIDDIDDLLELLQKSWYCNSSGQPALAPCLPENQFQNCYSNTLPGRERLRSAATQNYDIRRVKLKFGERAFAVAAPKAWNSLPDSLKQTNDTVKFRKDLKTYLFNLAYN